MFGSENKKSSKKKLVYSIVITGAMVASVILIHKAVGKFENEPEKQEIISAVQLEDRGFVMSVIIGEQTVVFEIASDQDKAWRDESRYVKLDTGLIEEAEKLYRENGEKKLDFSHMKVVFIQKEIYDGPVSYENLKYMYEEERFAKNILVCPLEKDLKDMAADAMEEGTAFAVKIENIMVNSDKSKTHELYKVYQSMEDKS